MSRAAAIILARAGSKGLPGKNVAELAGRPCIAWTIDAARNAHSVAHVAVSTDDPCAAAVARDMGMQVIERPPALASDTATVDDAARHAWGQLRERLSAGEQRPGPRARAQTAEGGSIDGAPLVILYANVPIRPPDLIDRAVARLIETGCDSVQSYAPVGKHHPYWTARLDDATGRVHPWEGEILNHNVFRRQDLPPAYIPDGGVIALTRRALLREVPGVPDGPHAFLGADRRGVLTREGDVVDVDTRVDLAVAEAILSAELRFEV